MPKNEPLRKLIVVGAALIIWAILTTIFAYVWYTYYSEQIVFPFFRKGNWLVVAFYAALMYLFLSIYGGYRIGYLKRGDIIYSSILAMLLVNVMAYLQISLIGRDWMPYLPVLGMCVVDAACIVLWALASDRLYARLNPPRRLLVIFGGDQVDFLVKKLKSRPDQYRICEMLAIDVGLESVFQRIRLYDSVLISDVKSPWRNEILKFCFSHAVHTYMTPKISDTIVRGADCFHLFDTPLLLCRNQGLTTEQTWSKRMLDLLIALSATLLTLPIMGIVALLVKLSDGGPVLYKQTRLTLNGKTFEVYKFRSMVVDAEKNGIARLSSQGDRRITPLGRILRKIRLDELPQLLNILKGDMSIVGPRPERPEIAAQYEKQMPEFSFRLKVKAGLTGYAQIMGKYNTTPYDKLKLDLMYIESYSLLLDMKLILMTIKILFMPESTEGISPDSTTAIKEAPLKKPPFQPHDGIPNNRNEE